MKLFFVFFSFFSYFMKINTKKIVAGGQTNNSGKNPQKNEKSINSYLGNFFFFLKEKKKRTECNWRRNYCFE